MKNLVAIASKKDYVISKEHVKKIKIKHLDDQYFTKNIYVSKICGDGIITYNDICDYNPEIKDLYKEFLINSSEINNIYNQLFDGFDDYIFYAISDENSWSLSKNILDNFEESHSKKYSYLLIKKVILSTPTFNSFDLGDYCLREYCDNFKLLTERQSKELLLLMNSNQQIINSKKAHYDEFRKRILDLFSTYDYNYLIEAINNNDEILPF